jgi:hypothetical protein
MLESHAWSLGDTAPVFDTSWLKRDPLQTALYLKCTTLRVAFDQPSLPQFILTHRSATRCNSMSVFGSEVSQKYPNFGNKQYPPKPRTL